ncbi:WXG100 family type VII secretion target OS=Streptomyces fumanus OX=67302 GN=GCM10018772_70970 PE=4 SV=1 [Streptomyces fumanus]
MADYGQYRGDVTALRSGANRLEGIRADFLALQNDFWQEVRQYDGWYGTTDEFATTTGPQYEKNKESCLSVLGTMVDIGGGLVTAKLSEMRAVQQPQNYAMDEINLAGLDAEGGTDTGRR